MSSAIANSPEQHSIHDDFSHPIADKLLYRFGPGNFLRRLVLVTQAARVLIQAAQGQTDDRNMWAKQLNVKVLSCPGQRIVVAQPKWWSHCPQVKIVAGGPSPFDRPYIVSKVHGECALALHLIQENRTGIPSQPYISASRNPCLACSLLLRGLR